MRALAVCLVQALHRSDQLVAQVFTARPLSSRLVANALNVAVLAIKLGMGLQYASEDLLDVAMAALLHDLEQLMAPEFPMRRASHGGVGNEIPQPLLPTCHGPLLKHLPEYAWLGAVAGQVQERWNGQGRPQGLKGAAIHEYAQVIGLADRFETLVNVEGLTAHEAMRRLLTTEKAAFRGQLLKTLVQQISLFPVGTVVRLNTGEVGTVEQTNPAHPLRPVLRMASGPPRAAHEGRPLKDLSQDLLVHIEKAIGNPS
jgi:response regulator RpfG family c-di-GMP phosphodiesterase